MRYRNISVLCTGRCGSTTFIKASGHIRNYSAVHESRTANLGHARFAYPNFHIEADNRLSWLLGRLDSHYRNEALQPGTYQPGRQGTHANEDSQGGIGRFARDPLSRCKSIRTDRRTRGVHRASSIKTAEAAKVIENKQRDLNIALMNELAVIFDKLDIDTNYVLEAAGTKWNFLKFKPGLVGGHCIGADPYYLTHKAQMLGYHPQVILAGRRINDGMGKYIAETTVKKMISAGSVIKGARVNVLGLTFKENCADLRNSKVIDIIRELENYGIEVAVTEAWADNEEAMNEYGIKIHAWKDLPIANSIVSAVAHREYQNLTLENISKILAPQGVVIDIKSTLDKDLLRKSGYSVWRL